MKTKFQRTKCTVKLQQSPIHRGEYYLQIELYPVFEGNNDKPIRKFLSLKQKVTTPIWDKERPTRGGKFLPKRNADGIIQCRSEADQHACNMAQKFCQKQQAEYDNEALYPELYKQQKEKLRKENLCFLQYIRQMIERRRPTVGDVCHRQWGLMLRLLEQFEGKRSVRFGDLTVEWCNRFREFMMTAKSAHTDQMLAPNTQKIYFAHFKAALYSAYKEDILPTNLSIKIEQIKGEETYKMHLTQEELQQLANTPCGNDETRRAALFSALTGLRFSDIQKLTWNEITGTDQNPKIEFRQKKTKNLMYLHISKDALALCGKRTKPDTPVFPNITAAEHVNETIGAWVKRAGIAKHITFHCFRHTFAVLQLEGGIDLYTVSKRMGHTSVKTTEGYLKLTDKNSRQAADTIKLTIRD